MRNLAFAVIAVLLPSPAAHAGVQLGCAARIEMSNFRPLEGEAPERRVLGYLYEIRNLSTEALLVQPSFGVPPGATLPILGSPVMLRPQASAIVSLPSDATVVAGQYGMDLSAITRATRASCTLR